MRVWGMSEPAQLSFLLTPCPGVGVGVPSLQSVPTTSRDGHVLSLCGRPGHRDSMARAPMSRGITAYGGPGGPGRCVHGQVLAQHPAVLCRLSGCELRSPALCQVCGDPCPWPAAASQRYQSCGRRQAAGTTDQGVGRPLCREAGGGTCAGRALAPLKSQPAAISSLEGTLPAAFSISHWQAAQGTWRARGHWPHYRAAHRAFDVRGRGAAQSPAHLAAQSPAHSAGGKPR